MNMGKLTPVIISMMMFAGVILGLATFYNDINTQYTITNSTAEESFTVFNDSFETMNDHMYSLQNKTSGFYTKGITDPTRYTDALMAFVDIGNIIFQIPNILITFTQNSFTFLPYVPDWFKTMIGSIIVIYFTMKIAAIFVKMDDI